MERHPVNQHRRAEAKAARRKLRVASGKNKLNALRKPKRKPAPADAAA